VSRADADEQLRLSPLLRGPVAAIPGVALRLSGIARRTVVTCTRGQVRSFAAPLARRPG
jgi:hypothetical protein